MIQDRLDDKFVCVIGSYLFWVYALLIKVIRTNPYDVHSELFF